MGPKTQRKSGDIPFRFNSFSFFPFILLILVLFFFLIQSEKIRHTGSKFEMDVATFGLDFLEECTTQGRTRSPSDGVPLFQGSFCSIIPWPIRWHEYDTLQMILGIFRHHGAHSCRLSGSNNLLMWLAQHGCLRTELNQFVANS